MNSRVCAGCGVEFFTNHSHQKYHSHECYKTTVNQTTYERNKSTILGRCKLLLSLAKNRAKKKLIPFDLDIDFLVDLWFIQNGQCSVSGLDLNLESPKNGLPLFDAPSLDRIVPEKGYIKGNVRLTTYMVNVGISNYGFEQYLSLCRAITNHNKE